MTNPESSPPSSQNPMPVTPRPRDDTAKGFATGLTISLVIFSLLGLLGGVLAFSYVKKKEVDVRKGWNLVPVVVAAQDIPENTVVAMDMISQRSVPEQFVTSSVVKPDSASYIVNQRTLVPLQAGDMMLWSAFETTKAAERISQNLAAAQRLVSLKVSAEASVGGWVRPNDHVDVIAVYPGENKEPQVTTLLTNVTVVATGAISGTTNINLIPPEGRAFTTVTLRVSADDAERLAIMANVGTLTLSLRPEGEPAAPRSSKRSVRDVVGR